MICECDDTKPTDFYHLIISHVTDWTVHSFLQFLCVNCF